MNLDNFDKEIKKRVELFEEDYDPTSWDILSSKIDAADLDSDTSVDEDFIPHIKDSLQNHKEPLNEEHWQVMKGELDRLDMKRRKLFISKFIEAAIVLLLLMTYFNYQSFKNYPRLQLDESFVQNQIDDQESGNIIAQSFTSTDEFNSISHVVAMDESLIRTTRFVAPLSTDVILESTGNSLPLFQEIIVVNEENQNNVEENTRSLDRMGISPLSIAREKPVMSPITASEVSDNPKPKNLYLSIPFSFDLNLINSSFDFNYLTSPLNSGLFGSSIGVLLGKKVGIVELESGLIFSEKTYAPGLLKSYTKSSASSYLESALDAADFQQISVPVVAKLAIPSNKVWNVYAVAGVGFNAIMKTSYTVSKKIQPSARIGSAVQQETLDLSALPNGLAQGGAIMENIFLTGIAGIGAQANIKNDMAVYFQPQYQFNLTTNSNQLFHKVHSLNLQAGLKFKF